MSAEQPGVIVASAVATLGAARKAWPLAGVEVTLTYRLIDDVPSIERRIRIDGLDETQRERCGGIADKTPVTRALKRGIEIRTTLTAPG